MRWYIHAVLQEEIEKGRGRVLSASVSDRNWRTPNGLAGFRHERSNGPATMRFPASGISGADGAGLTCGFPAMFPGMRRKIPNRPGYFQYNTWNALPLVIQEMFETAGLRKPEPTLMEKLTMFLLPFLSVLERNGSRPIAKTPYWELPAPSLSLVRDGSPRTRCSGTPIRKPS